MQHIQHINVVGPLVIAVAAATLLRQIGTGKSFQRILEFRVHIFRVWLFNGEHAQIVLCRVCRTCCVRETKWMKYTQRNMEEYVPKSTYVSMDWIRARIPIPVV